ncbi:unnamed protein product, partial [Discosporangium mesarthrocarpum]
RYPQIYASERKLLLDPRSIKVTRANFMSAMKGMAPASKREGLYPSNPLPADLIPLVGKTLSSVTSALRVHFPFQSEHHRGEEPDPWDCGCSNGSDTDTDNDTSNGNVELGGGSGNLAQGIAKEPSRSCIPDNTNTNTNTNTSLAIRASGAERLGR